MLLFETILYRFIRKGFDTTCLLDRLVAENKKNKPTEPETAK